MTLIDRVNTLERKMAAIDHTVCDSSGEALVLLDDLYRELQHHLGPDFTVPSFERRLRRDREDRAKAWRPPTTTTPK